MRVVSRDVIEHSPQIHVISSERRNPTVGHISNRGTEVSGLQLRVFRLQPSLLFGDDVDDGLLDQDGGDDTFTAKVDLSEHDPPAIKELQPTGQQEA
jgi:hypothetical protein